MNKVLGIFGLLLAVCVIATIVQPQFMLAFNLYNVMRYSSMFAILGIGVSLVIITGGIDLSIGSVVGLMGCVLLILVVDRNVPVVVALLLVLLLSALVGLVHGLLITQLRLQPFVVTLCGLLVYRGLARWLTGDQTKGLGTGFDQLRWLAMGKPFDLPVPFLKWISEGHWGRWKWNARAGDYVRDEMGDAIVLPWLEWVSIPAPLLIMAAIAVVVALFLRGTIWGRYLLALGRNRQAARYSGIHTERMTILAYVICSTLAGVGAILFALESNLVEASMQGNFFELYAIAAAVLGGCSLRGGEGSILGVVIGAALIRVLYNAANVMGMPAQLEFAVIGIVILGGVSADEIVRRVAARRRVRVE